MSEVHIKSPQEIELMRTSGRLLAQVFHMLDAYIKSGITTMSINDKVEHYITKTLLSRPASKGQYGFEYVLNSSVNDVICHGIPSGYKLKGRDIVNIDITLEKNGFIAC